MTAKLTRYRSTSRELAEGTKLSLSRTVANIKIEPAGKGKKGEKSEGEKG